MSNSSTAMSKAHPAFRPIRQQTIESLNIQVEQFEHEATGAMHYHLASDNTENVFLVALRTVPHDSTGVAHILEHTALCGSEHFPVRDPFFMMLRRSLNTFMNAFTSSDWTAYPFASQNRKDFNNLLDVYLDAVFFSRLDPLDFAQEGHRVEFAEADSVVRRGKLTRLAVALGKAAKFLEVGPGGREKRAGVNRSAEIDLEAPEFVADLGGHKRFGLGLAE